MVVFNDNLHDNILKLNVHHGGHRLLLWPHQCGAEDPPQVGHCHQVLVTVRGHPVHTRNKSVNIVCVSVKLNTQVLHIFNHRYLVICDVFMKDLCFFTRSYNKVHLISLNCHCLAWNRSCSSPSCTPSKNSWAISDEPWARFYFPVQPAL